MKWLFLIAVAASVALPAHAQPAPAANAAAGVTLPATRVVKTAAENTIRHISGADLASALNSKKPTDALTEVLISEAGNYRVPNTFRAPNRVVEFHHNWSAHL